MTKRISKRKLTVMTVLMLAIMLTTVGIFYACKSDPLARVKVDFVVPDELSTVIQIKEQKVFKFEHVNEPKLEAEYKVGDSTYKFIGWYTEKEYTNLFDFKKTKISQDTTLYGKFEKE